MAGMIGPVKPRSRAPLGQEERTYIRGRLEGGLALSASVMECLNLSEGETFTWATDPSSPLIKEFDRGGLGIVRERTGNILGLVRSFFSSTQAGSLWVEEPNRRRSDPFWTNPAVARDRGTAWFFGEEVYSLAFAEDRDERILSALAEGWQWAGWGGASYLAESQASARYREVHEIDRGDLENVASSVNYIICGAYDGEGWVVWESTQR